MNHKNRTLSLLLAGALTLGGASAFEKRKKKPGDLKKLQSQKFTVREIEILVGRSKSSVARDLKEGVMNE